MKKSLIALAALAATSAFAQSSVTISGRMDAGVRYTAKVAPGAANYTIADDGGANQIRFAISEDLGGGLRAVADVGMRLDINTGLSQTGGTRPLFQGETRVGVVGGFGTIKFGRGLTAVQGPVGSADPWGVTTVAGTVYAPGFATDYAAGGEGRIDQGIFYTSPNISGFTLGLSASPRKLVGVQPTTATTASTTQYVGTSIATPVVTINAAAPTTTKTHMSLYAGYSAGPLSINLGHEQNRVGDTMTPIWGSYNAGFATLIAHYNTIKGGSAADRSAVTMAACAGMIPQGSMAPNTANCAGSQVAADGKIDNYGIGAIIPMGAMSFRLGYSTWNGNGSAGQKDDVKMGAGVRYTLSKRTYLHANVATQTRKNVTASTRDDRTNTKQSLFDTGVVHSF